MMADLPKDITAKDIAKAWELMVLLSLSPVFSSTHHCIHCGGYSKEGHAKDCVWVAAIDLRSKYIKQA